MFRLAYGYTTRTMRYTDDMFTKLYWRSSQGLIDLEDQPKETIKNIKSYWENIARPQLVLKIKHAQGTIHITTNRKERSVLISKNMHRARIIKHYDNGFDKLLEI